MPVMEIRYPPILQGVFLTSARTLIGRCPPEERQPVLDEIAAMHARGRVRSPLGLLKSLVDKAGSGQFLSSHSLSVHPESLTQDRSGARVQQSLTDANPAPKPLALASEIGRETLSRRSRVLCRAWDERGRREGLAAESTTDHHDQGHTGNIGIW